MVNSMKLKKGSKEAKAFMAKIRAAKGKPKKKVGGWNKGGTFIIESNEKKPANAKKVIKVTRRKVVKAGTFKDFKTINGITTIKLDKKLASTEYQKTLTYINNFEKLILKIKNALPTVKTLQTKTELKKELAYIKKMLAEYKTHAKELKKLI